MQHQRVVRGTARARATRRPARRRRRRRAHESSVPSRCLRRQPVVGVDLLGEAARPAVPRRRPRARVPRRVDQYSAIGLGSVIADDDDKPWGGLPPVSLFATQRWSCHARIAAAGRRDRVRDLRLRERRRPPRTGAVVGARRPRVGGRPRQRAHRPDGVRAGAADRAARDAPRTPVRRGPPRPNPRARERAGGVEQADTTFSPGQRPHRSTSSTACPT